MFNCSIRANVTTATNTVHVADFLHDIVMLQTERKGSGKVTQQCKENSTSEFPQGPKFPRVRKHKLTVRCVNVKPVPEKGSPTSNPALADGPAGTPNCNIPGVRWMVKDAFDARASQHWNPLRQKLQSLYLAGSATVHQKTEPTMQDLELTQPLEFSTHLQNHL